MYKKQKSVTEMFDEKQTRIAKYVNDKSIDIRIGQALNLAVETITQLQKEVTEAELDKWVDFYFDYSNRKRGKIVNKIAREIERREQGLEVRDLADDEATGAQEVEK